MNIFLTGITGHMGFNILRSLAGKKYSVTALVRDLEYANDLIKNHLPGAKKIKLVKGDLSDRDSLARGMKGSNVVINSAAVVGLRKEKAEEQARTNIEGVRNLLESARKTGVRRFIQISTIQTVRSGTYEAPADESGPLSTDCRDPYCTSKLEADNLSLSYSGRGLEVILISPGLLAGPYDFKASAVTNLIRFSRGGLSIFYPPGGITVSDVEQVAESTVAAIKKGKPGQRYILGGANLSYKEMYRILHRVTGSAPPLIPLPSPLLRAVASVMEFMETRFRISFTVNSHRIRLICQKECYSSSLAQDTLGFSGGDVEGAFGRAYEWLTANGLL